MGNKQRQDTPNQDQNINSKNNNKSRAACTPPTQRCDLYAAGGSCGRAQEGQAGIEESTGPSPDGLRGQGVEIYAKKAKLGGKHLGWKSKYLMSKSGGIDILQYRPPSIKF
ncbi:hypothetical protein TNCV_772301 [Trichonephila clavipes]|nr:hypothetical protein TNCV_772301 [Trichonephila clavipes]